MNILKIWGRNSPESVLKLMRTVISVLLLKLNVPKEEVAEFTDRIERRDFSVLFEHFEAYDVQETRRISKAEGKSEDIRIFCGIWVLCRKT